MGQTPLCYTLSMKLHFKKPLPATPLALLRRAGYQPFTDPKTNEESFTRKLTPEFYPRYHIYVKETDTVVTFDLHLDQKKPNYSGNHMHSGEYEGRAVEDEVARIRQTLRS